VGQRHVVGRGWKKGKVLWSRGRLLSSRGRCAVLLRPAAAAAFARSRGRLLSLADSSMSCCRVFGRYVFGGCLHRVISRGWDRVRAGWCLPRSGLYLGSAFELCFQKGVVRARPWPADSVSLNSFSLFSCVHFIGVLLGVCQPGRVTLASSAPSAAGAGCLQRGGRTGPDQPLCVRFPWSGGCREACPCAGCCW